MERLYSGRGSYQGQGGGLHTRQKPEMADAFKSVPFRSLAYLNWTGKFIRGGVTDMRASGDRYLIYERAG